MGLLRRRTPTPPPPPADASPAEHLAYARAALAATPTAIDEHGRRVKIDDATRARMDAALAVSARRAP